MGDCWCGQPSKLGACPGALVDDNKFGFSRGCGPSNGGRPGSTAPASEQVDRQSCHTGRSGRRRDDFQVRSREPAPGHAIFGLNVARSGVITPGHSTRRVLTSRGRSDGGQPTSPDAGYDTDGTGAIPAGRRTKIGLSTGDRRRSAASSRSKSSRATRGGRAAYDLPGSGFRSRTRHAGPIRPPVLDGCSTLQRHGGAAPARRAPESPSRFPRLEARRG